ncbi:MAG: ferrous iron transport protein A [Eggerthellaceae bacterium]|nr:ferrous iron transport protein A [Eggerthellaceae bacterium]
MPLTFMRPGEEARIIKVRGKGDVHHHLENLGFVQGAKVKVMAEQSGNLIVEVKGTQVALDKASAQKIITG